MVVAVGRDTLVRRLWRSYCGLPGCLDLGIGGLLKFHFHVLRVKSMGIDVTPLLGGVSHLLLGEHAFFVQRN